MFYNAKEGKLNIKNASFDYIQFGTGKKTLLMIQGLSTNGIKGASLSLAYMYRMFAKEYTVYLFDRRDEVYDGITVKDFALDIAEKMYSDEYVKRYQLFMPLLTVLQKPKNIERFLILAKSCLTCSTYDELEKIQCPVLVIGGKQDKVVSGAASEEIAEKLGCECYLYENLGLAAYEEAKDFNDRVFHFFKK